MVERRVEDQLRRMAPPLLGGGRAIFTEDNLQAAFPGKKNADAGIDYGHLVLLAEVVTTQVSLPARENVVIAYGKDIELAYLHRYNDIFFADQATRMLLRTLVTVPYLAEVRPLIAPAEQAWTIVADVVDRAWLAVRTCHLLHPKLAPGCPLTVADV